MGTARARCDNLAIAAREPYDYPKSQQSSYDFFDPNNHLKPYVVRTISARHLCGGRPAIVQCYLRVPMGYGRFFKIYHSAELNKTVEATAPVNPYDNPVATGCLRTEAARKGRYGHLTGVVSSSQAKCKVVPRPPHPQFPTLSIFPTPLHPRRPLILSIYIFLTVSNFKCFI